MAHISRAQTAPDKQIIRARTGGLRGPEVSKSTGRLIGRLIGYTILLIGAVIMFFPMFWMVTASFKPQWQILTSPPIWIPSKWLQVHAGNTAKEFPLWDVKDSAGEKQRVIELGTRDYAAVVDVSRLTVTDLVAVPAGDLGDARTTVVGGVTLNVRVWKSESGKQQVVALAKDGANMVVIPFETLAQITERRPLDEVNKGKQAKVTVGDFTFQARQLADRAMLQVGPKTALSVVAPKEIAASAFIVADDAPVDPQFVPIGDTALEFYALQDRPATERYVVLGRETWQPIIDFKILKDYGFVVEDTRLSGNREDREFGPALTMPVDTVTQADGSTVEVVILFSLAGKSFVIPSDHTETLRLTPVSKGLGEPYVQTIQGMAVRYIDNYAEGDQQFSVAIVGERGCGVLVAPQSAVTDAFAVPTKALERVLKIRFRWENYTEALSRDLGEHTTFFTFYRNSFLVVTLNLIGHYFSVTLVAYGFARLRAPGKNLLFLLLLSTMMLPFPVLLIPTYEIFDRFGMLNTLWPLFIRSFFGNAFLIFLLRQFFMSIPQELEDAARIDGANTLQVLWHVMLPLSKPALATVGIFTFLWNWNSFFEPYVYISSIKYYTVSLGLAYFKGQYVYTFHWLMAAGVAAIMPVILIFFFAQRYFIEGIQLTGLKG